MHQLLLEESRISPCFHENVKMSTVTFIEAELRKFWFFFWRLGDPK